MGSGSAAMRALLFSCGESLVHIISSLGLGLGRDDLLSVASFRERHTRPPEAPRLAALLLRWSSAVSLLAFFQLEQRQRRRGKQQRQRR